MSEITSGNGKLDHHDIDVHTDFPHLRWWRYLQFDNIDTPSVFR